MTKRDEWQKHGDSAQYLLRSSETSASLLATLERAIESIPALPAKSLHDGLRFAARLPEELRSPALQMLSMKLAADFAMRYLTLLNGMLTEHAGDDHQPALDVSSGEDRKALYELLDLWAQVPRSIRVHNLAEFDRFARITAGLQIMIDATPPRGHDSWIFDSGPQYRCMLLQTSLLPAAAMTAHILPGGSDERNVKVESIRFDSQAAASHRAFLQWISPTGVPSSSEPVRPRLVVDAAAPIEPTTTLASA